MGSSNGWIEVKAKIFLQTTAEGGRKSGIISGYRPNHYFEKPSSSANVSSYIGEICFENQEYILLGESSFVTVKFLKHQSIEKFMKVGQHWFIYEGSKYVGGGEIIEV